MFRSEDKTGFRHYWKEEGGLKYPSVTSILGVYEDKEFLEQWIRINGEPYSNFIRHYTADIGTETHLQIEKGTPLNAYACAIWEDFYKNVSIVSSEQTLWYEDEKVRYAGSYDSLGYLPVNHFHYRSSRSTKAAWHSLEGGSAIIDLKTKAIKPDSQWKLQSGKIPRTDNTSFTLKNLIQVSTYASIEEVDYAVVAYVAKLKTKMKTHLLVLTKPQIDYYSKIFYNLCLDYFQHKPMGLSWEELVEHSSANYLPYTMQCSTSLTI